MKLVTIGVYGFDSESFLRELRDAASASCSRHRHRVRLRYDVSFRDRGAALRRERSGGVPSLADR